MTDIQARNLSLYWTTIFFRELHQLGIRHVIISPGSRSTPLTLAAAANDHLRKHVILDERAAAFTALGIGKATNRPAVLICTSGTALANYYPAVIEARQSGVPMILTTADRPPHLRGTGANQAIDQLKIFGDYPVLFHEVGEPNPDEKDLKRLKMLGRQSVKISRQLRGPVHLNFPFRKPLEPEAPFLEKIKRENRAGQTSAPPDLFVRETQHLQPELQQKIAEAEKPLIVLGPTAAGDDTGSIAALARQLNCPILSEAAVESPLAVKGFAGFLRNSQVRSELEPDLILRFGFQPTAKSLELAFSEWQADRHVHFASTDAWQDATFSGACHIPWLGRSLAISEISGSPLSGWLERWRYYEKRFQKRTEECLSAETRLTDGAVYQALTPQIPSDSFLAVSNSFPARDIGLFGKHSPSVPIFLNRGASGIDGVTSTAMGLSLTLRKPGILFTGDLAFLHDTTALLAHKQLTAPLTVIVINNSGGSIFRMLPLQELEPYFVPYFETPQTAEIAQLVKAHDIPYEKIDSLSSLTSLSLQMQTNRDPGLTVIECITDADASMRLREKLWKFQS